MNIYRPVLVLAIFILALVLVLPRQYIQLNASPQALCVLNKTVLVVSADKQTRPGFFFVVYTPDYSEHCGGCTVLHLLAHKLNCLAKGQPIAYLVPMGYPGKPATSLTTNPGYSTPYLPPWLNAADGVAVYPEVVSGNPLQARHVVRYILYFPGVNGGPPAAAYDGVRDIIICFSPGVCSEFDGKFKYMDVRVVDYYFDYLEGLAKDQPRNGTLILHKKGTWTTRKGKLHRPPDTQQVAGQPVSGGKRNRLEMFSRAELFVSYDAASFISVEAAMAGCPSVVIPFPGVSKAEWLNSTYVEMQHGVAYGFDDLPNVKPTLGNVVLQLRALSAQQDHAIKLFIDDVMRRFNLSSTTT